VEGFVGRWTTLSEDASKLASKREGEVEDLWVLLSVIELVSATELLR